MAPLEITYYVIVAFAAAAYFALILYFRLPLFTFSTVNYVLAVILTMIPGYLVSAGELIPVASRGFDWTLYVLYITYVVVLPTAAVAGQVLGSRRAILGEMRPRMWLRWRVAVLGVVIYAVGYCLWTPAIPLVSLLRGAVDLTEAASQRIRITHQLATFGSDLPFLFRYWRSILQLYPVVLVLIYLFAFHEGIKKSRLMLVGLILGTCFLLTFTLEKAQVVAFLFALVIARSFVDGRFDWLRLIMAGILSVSLSAVLYTYFMGAARSDLLNSMVERLAVQSASIYYQIEYIYHNGFLGFRTFQIPFGSFIFGPTYHVDLARAAFGAFNPASEENLWGSAAGLSIAEQYFAFGWFGVPVFGAFVFMYSWIDQAWRNGIYHPAVSLDYRRFAAAVYIFGIAAFYATFFSSVFLVIALPFGLSAQGLFVMALLVLFARPASFRILPCRAPLRGPPARALMRPKLRPVRTQP